MPMPPKAAILIKYQVVMKFSLFRMPLINATSVPESAGRLQLTAGSRFNQALGTTH